MFFSSVKAAYTTAPSTSGCSSSSSPPTRSRSPGTQRCPNLSAMETMVPSGNNSSGREARLLTLRFQDEQALNKGSDVALTSGTCTGHKRCGLLCFPPLAPMSSQCPPAKQRSSKLRKSRIATTTHSDPIPSECRTGDRSQVAPPDLHHAGQCSQKPQPRKLRKNSRLKDECPTMNRLSSARSKIAPSLPPWFILSSSLDQDASPRSRKKLLKRSSSTLSTQFKSPFLSPIIVTPFVFPEPSVSPKSSSEHLNVQPLKVDWSAGPASKEGHLPNLELRRSSFLRTESTRRWTAAITEVTDVMLVEELERLRRMGMKAKEVHGPISEHHENAPNRLDPVTEMRIYNFSGPPSMISSLEPGSDDCEWISARRAMLCCRELIVTERSYLERLERLSSLATIVNVDENLRPHINALISASKLLTTLFAKDPSTWGVSNAFLQAGVQVEQALVSWSEVVGEFFTSTDVQRSKTVKSAPSNTTDEASESSRSITSTSSQNTQAQPQRNKRASSIGMTLFLSPLSPTPSDLESQLSASSPSVSDACNSGRSWRNPKSLKLSRTRNSFDLNMVPFRELAIQPTQRVTRYVLLFKDLLVHTPASSASRGVVERAVVSATHIARTCDKSQKNAFFSPQIEL